MGLQDADQIGDALRILKELGIPEGAVVIEEEHIRLLAGEDSVGAK